MFSALQSVLQNLQLWFPKEEELQEWLEVTNSNVE